MAHDVFISYANPDKVVADAICHRLEELGIRCWIAPRDVRVGRNWAGEVDNALTDAQLLVLVFSRATEHSNWVVKELTVAAGMGKPILAFRTEDVHPAAALKLILSDLHWMDALTEPISEHIERLAQNVVAQVSRVDEPPEPNLRENRASRADDRSPPLPVRTSPASPTESRGDGLDDDSSLMSQRLSSMPAERLSEELSPSVPVLEPTAETGQPLHEQILEPEPEVITPDVEPTPAAHIEAEPAKPDEPIESDEVEAPAPVAPQPPEEKKDPAADLNVPRKPIYELPAIPLSIGHFALMLGGFIVATVVSNSFMNVPNKFPDMPATNGGWITFAVALVGMYAAGFVPYLITYFVIWLIGCLCSSGQDTLVRGYAENIIAGAAGMGIVYELFGGRSWLLWFSIAGGFMGLQMAIKSTTKRFPLF